MTIRTTPVMSVQGAYLISPDVHPDKRGFFACVGATYSVPDEHAWRPQYSRWCIARSHQGVIRGLHYRPGAGEAKLVRCSTGALYDVIVDLRKDSPTYRNWVCFMLNGNDQLSVYIPAGCAHGYQALADDTDITYRIDAEYDPSADVAIAWNDPELAIGWPQPPTIMSDRDKNALTLKELGL